jgi:carboxylate-amine ligase
LSVRARSLGIIALVGPDADALGCRAEIEHARTIRERGTSAHRQRAVYQDAVAGGAEHMEALRTVVDWLIAETRAGL